MRILILVGQQRCKNDDDGVSAPAAAAARTAQAHAMGFAAPICLLNLTLLLNGGFMEDTIGGLPPPAVSSHRTRPFDAGGGEGEEEEGRGYCQQL